MRLAKRIVFAVTLLGVLLATGQAAIANWSTGASALGYGKARTMPTGNTPSVSVSGSSVTVSWSPSTFAGGTPVSGYVVNRYTAGSGTSMTIGAGCSGTVSGLSCVETTVPVGSWRYSVTPKQSAWTGTESPKSATMSVVAALTGVSLGAGRPSPATTMVTGAVSPSTSVVFAWILYVNTSGAPPTVSGVSGLSCTWASVTTSTGAVSANGSRRMSLWVGTGCSGSGTISITASTAPTSANAYALVEFAGGIDATSPYVSSNLKTAAASGVTSLSVTPNALAASADAYVVGVNHGTAENVSPTHASAAEITDDNAGATTGIETNALTGWTSGAMGGTWLTSSVPNTQATLVGVEVRAAVAPPAPSITAQPPNPTNQTSASFSFTDAQAGVTYRCQIDGGSFSACASPKSYAGLSQGSHTFDVVAANANGQESTATSVTWTIDTAAPPTPSITSAPANPSSSASPSFSFTDTEAGVSFQCQLDAGGYSTCTSPKTYSSLADGTHTFSVRAVDAAGNQSAAASSTWTIDATAPPTPSITSAPAASTTSTSATISFTDGEAGVSFECQLDGGGYASCTSPKAYSALTAGSHTFQVRAADAIGNRSSAASSTWTIDLTAPPTPTITSSPASFSSSTGASFSFTDAESGVGFECQLDAGGYSACTSPKAYASLAAGSHTFGVRAVDAATNASSAATWTWTIELTAPTVDASVIAKASGGSAGYVKKSPATFYVYANASDPGAGASGVASITADIGALVNGSGSLSLSTSGGPWTVDGSTYAYRSAAASATKSVLADGSYTYTVVATDVAGNTSATASYSVVVDSIAPTASDVQTTNAGTAGRAEQSDTLALTFSEQIDPSTILAGWTGTSTSVIVVITDGGAGNDVLTVTDPSSGALNLGSVDLGGTAYVSGNPLTFGASNPASTMVQSGATVTITLGKRCTGPGCGTFGTAGTGTITWTPSSAATDRAGNACVTTPRTRLAAAF